jgi:hypothetical protein
MSLRRVLFIAACILPVAVGAARAQFPSAPPQQEQQQAPPCLEEFGKLRDDTQKKASAIQAAGQRKASPKEACGLFNTFAAAEAKMLKYAADNAVWCGIPPEIIANIRTGHARTTDMRTKVCRIAAAPMPSQGPSLSDALSAPVTGSDNIKTGRGTFDTLTGTPLGR